MRRVFLVTGANTGVGYGIAESIIRDAQEGQLPLSKPASTSSSSSNYNWPISYGKQTSLKSPRVLEDPCPPIIVVLVCRNVAKAEAARDSLIATLYAHNPEEGQVAVQVLKCDLSDVRDVFRACDEARSRFSSIAALVFNAGVLPIKSLSYWRGTRAFLADPANLAQTSADVLVQKQGVRTADGQFGETFAANVLGHYIMLKELEPLMQTSAVSSSRPSVVVWTSSSTSDNKYLDPEDVQGLNGAYPYESSKRLLEVLHKDLQPTLARKGIYSFVTAPGIVVSNITQGFIPAWMLTMIMFMMRLFGIVGVNISYVNGATSVRHVVTCPIPQDLDPNSVYNSDIKWNGIRFVKPAKLQEPTSADLPRQLREQMDNIWMEQKQKLLTN